MQHSKTVFSNAFNDLILPQKTLEKLHVVLFMMLKDLDFVCRAEGLNYMLSGGTCLGAVRHSDFIPWDDDVDIMLIKQDYYKLPDAFKKHFGDKYTVAREHSSLSDPTSAMKIYLNGTKFVEIISQNWLKEQKIFIDVFCIVDVPNSSFSRKIKGTLYDIGAHCAGLKMEYKRPSPLLAERSKTDVDLRRYYKKRRRLGFIANLMPMRFWYWLCDNQIKYENPKSKYLAIPAGIRYSREILERSVFDGTTEVDFRDARFSVPVGWKKYLTNLYGDYMLIPPIEKREVHTAVEIDFGVYGAKK